MSHLYMATKAMDDLDLNGPFYDDDDDQDDLRRARRPRTRRPTELDRDWRLRREIEKGKLRQRSQGEEGVLVIRRTSEERGRSRSREDKDELNVRSMRGWFQDRDKDARRNSDQCASEEIVVSRSEDRTPNYRITRETVEIPQRDWSAPPRCTTKDGQEITSVDTLPSRGQERTLKVPSRQDILTQFHIIDRGIERTRSLSPENSLAHLSEEKLMSLTRKPRSRYRVDDSMDHLDDPDGAEEREIKEYRQVLLAHGRSASSNPRRSGRCSEYLTSISDHRNWRCSEVKRLAEASNKPSKNWETIKVPPGTNSVRIIGTDGASREVVLQNPSGAHRRRSSADFLHPTDTIDFLERPARLKFKPQRVSKDYVMKEALDVLGYDYEEADQFFYLMERIGRDDYIQLVDYSDKILHFQLARWQKKRLEKGDQFRRHSRF